MNTLNNEWREFLVKQQQSYDPVMFSSTTTTMENDESTTVPTTVTGTVDAPPTCEELVISTKTKCLYLNSPIPIYEVFWRVPVVPYWRPEEGVIKKQTKIICDSHASFEEYQERLLQLPSYSYNEKVIKFVDNTGYVPTDEGMQTTPLSKTAANRRRIKYKNERKLTIGISKKDILNVRRKEKQGAFYNCVALTLRIRYREMFHEVHAKVFNTGKIEVPGRIDSEMMAYIKTRIIDIMQPFVNAAETPLEYKACKRGVLINSGFKCGFYIDRDKINHILRNKYGIETSYDSCSYQGVKCKYYFNRKYRYDPLKQTGRILEEDMMKKKEMNASEDYVEVAFMIFRTGSCIIVGNCSKRVLYFIYDFIRSVLHNEYHEISMGLEEPAPTKNKKVRKMFISVTREYLEDAVK
jgi:hypothetical protein